jgi:hypothetical protein
LLSAAPNPVAGSGAVFLWRKSITRTKIHGEYENILDLFGRISET